MSEKPTHSTRFTRAARAESERLLRRRRRAAEQVGKTEGQLAAARAELEEIDNRLQVLRALTDEQPELRAAASQENGSGQVLTGAEIRTVAVELLLDSGQSGPIHYRRWLEMLEASGYRVDGKRPDAVFLGQIMRSPVVKATTNAGIYQLDEGALERLGQKIADLERQLGESSADGAADPRKLEQEMERREVLSSELRRAQRELKEALMLLRRPNTRLAA